MKQSMKLGFVFLGLLDMAFLSGCATAGQNTLPSGGPMTMSAIYTAQTGTDANHRSPRKRLQNQMPVAVPVMTTSYTLQQPITPVSQGFKLLPNPEIPMHVYPHLVHDEAGSQPVPAYTTAFFLYRRNHFALPNELY